MFSLGFFFGLCIPFSILLSIGIFLSLENVFEIIKCIFVISYVLGLYDSVLFWTVL
jgi:hypothetical protein